MIRPRFIVDHVRAGYHGPLPFGWSSKVTFLSVVGQFLAKWSVALQMKQALSLSRNGFPVWLGLGDRRLGLGGRRPGLKFREDCGDLERGRERLSSYLPGETLRLWAGIS